MEDSYNRKRQKNQITEKANNNKTGADDQEEVKLLQKQKFAARESLLTELLQTNHIRTIYHIFVAILIVLFFSTAVHDYFEEGKISLGWVLIRYHFQPNQLLRAMLIWLELFSLTYLAFFTYFSWAKLRNTLDTKRRKKLDLLYSVFNFIYFVFYICLPCVQIFKCQFRFAMGSAILIEQVRLIMKVYSFLRENIGRSLIHRDTKSSLMPSFNSFSYFLFAPTLIYQDQYPRTAKIRWNFALKSLSEVLCIILYFAFMVERYLLPNIKRFQGNTSHWRDLLIVLFDNSLPSLTIFIFGFFLVLHAWQNFCAEILRFADRRFYTDWWNATNFGAYYRTWNIIVYSWLHKYIYEDSIQHLGLNKSVAKALVIGISAIFHEYILTFALRFYLPLFLVIYGIGGTLLIFMSSRHQTLSNIGIWFGLIMGTGMFSTAYLIEAASRGICPRVFDSEVLDFIYPRTFSCIQ